VGSAADTTAKEITRRGGAAVSEHGTVATPGGGEAIVRAAVDTFGTVDALVNNAGQLRNAAFEHMTVENVAPLVDYLVSRDCTETRTVFSVGASHGARVFVGATAGWYSPDPTTMTPEDVAANLDAAVDLAGFGIPDSMNEASRFVAQHLPEAR
jgi:NAD(P)-dependent dehydrogenase (short-subunit alcohol dehydrogenase family)